MASEPIIPFDYLEREKRRQAQRDQRGDPISNALSVMQGEQTRSLVLQAPDPDTTAKVTRAARQSGEPAALVEDRLGDIERADRADKIGAVLGAFPVYQPWAQENPRGVVAASDDHNALGILGEAWDWAKAKLPGTAKASAYRLASTQAQINRLGADFIGGAWDWLSSVASPNTQTVGELEERRAQRKAYWSRGVSNPAMVAQQARPAYSGWLEENVLQGIEQAPSSLVATVAGVATRSPAMSTFLMGTQVGLPAVDDARQRGLDPVRAGIYGLTQGGIEAITEKIPASTLLDAITKKTPFGKALIKQLGEEIPNEQIATVVQDFTEWATLNSDRPFSEYVAARPEAALSTLVQTAVGTTVQTAAVKAAAATVEAGAKVAGRVGQAKEAQDGQVFFDRVERAAKQSKLRQRDPEAYSDLIQRTSQEAGVSSVFVPAEAIRAYQQSDAYDQFDDPFSDYQAQIDEADAIGGDVVLPAGFALGVLPGTAAWDAIKTDMRLAPGGMSSREADAMQAELDDVMSELTDQAMTRDRDQQGELDARGQIVERVTAMLQNAGFTPANARMQAELIAQRETTRAARMGRDLTGSEFGTEVVSVLPPALGEIVKADRVDLVVNALRKGGPAVRQRGKSLLDWISARGGVEDRGGDVAAMGGAEWHKGKVGKRKLLKAFNDAQGNMLGSSGANPNTIGNLLDAAISEGFFPELLARRENGEKIDDRELLDAIGQELGGSPLYAEEPVVDGVREAADELAALLSERGLDPAGMSDAEIRAAVSRMAQEGSGDVVYDQTVREGRIRRTIDELVAAAESQESWRTWYQRHEQTIIDMFGEDADLFQKLLSATSQATGVKGNVTLALKAYDQLFSGEEFTGYLPAVIKNLERIKADENLAGAKISQYGKANEGDTSAIAVDRHIAMLFFNTKTPNPKQIAAAKKRIVEIAKRLAWEPRQVQAALWAFNQVRLGTDPDKVESYDKILEARIGVVSALRSKHGRGEDGSISADGRSLEGDSAGQASAEQRLAPRQLFQSDEFQNYGNAPLSDVVEVDDLVSDEMVPSLTAQDLVGLKIFPTISDRTAAAAIYGGIDSAGAERKIALLGGPLFPLRETNWLANVVWANRGKGVTAQKADKLVKGATHMMVVMGDADMHISNTTVQNAFLSTIEAYIRTGRISPENLGELAELVRTPSPEVTDSKTGQIREKSKEVLAIEKRLAEFPGFNDVRAFEDYVHSLSFEARKRILQIMASKKAQAFGAPSMTRILDATREPSMAGHRWGDGVLLVELDKDRPFITLGEEGTMPHPDFPLGIRGKVVGRMKTPLNYETLWSEWTKDAKAKGKKNVRRAFELAKPVIKVTQELADQIAASEASGIDSARQARLAVDFVLGNWKTTDAGVKQGGISPQEYLDAIANSPAKAVLSEYTLKKVKADVKTGAMTVYQLGADGQIFFALKRGDPSYAADYGIETPGITDNEVMLTSVINNEQGARGVGGPAVVLKALQEGATVLDCFAVKNDKFVDGFLPKLYAEFGFEKVAEVPFDPSYYDDTKLAEAVRYWKESTPGYDPETHGYPPLVIMKWAGTDEQRASIVQRYLSGGLEDILSRGTHPDDAAASAEFNGNDRSSDAAEGLATPDASGTGGDQGNAGRGLSDRLRRLVGAVGAITPEGARNLGLTPEEVERVGRGEGRTFNQDTNEQTLNEGPRGRILIDGNRPFRIELFQSRNLSTLLHELSHQWLEELRADAESPDAPEQVKADWDVVSKWFAANGHPITDGVIPAEAHEMWARGGERYLMEGKAPSSALQRLFETFRGWMLNIYKTVDALRTPITPEIREVFDRLLATDEEIAAMAEMQALQPLFKDAAAIGMTGQEFDAYTAQAQAARDDANGSLLAKTMAAIRRRETKKFRDEKRAVMADEAERLDDEPVLRSIRLMRDTPVDQEWLVDRMGQDVLGLLPKRVPPLWREGGVNPDSLAELAGFDSGQQMIEVLLGAERQHREAREGGDQRTMRARMIEQAADAEMTRRYGDDPLNDGSIEQEAIAAVNGELQGELLASEVRLLSRRTGARPTPYKIARQWARNRVRSGVVSVEASPGAIQRHARNVAKAGRDAEKAMLAGKMDEALRFKQQQMLSSALLAEAKAAHDEVQDAVKRMGKIANRKTMKSIDQDYLEQAQALLEAVDLKERTQKSIERQGKWEAWSAAREAEGYEIVVPPSFEATLGRTNWSRLSVETLLGLDEAVKQVMHLGRLKQSLLDNQEQREWDEIWREAENAGGNIDGPPPKDMTDLGWWGALKGRVVGADAALLKMETVFDWLDGGDPNGVFNRMAFRPIAAAQAREQDMLKDYYGRIKALFEAVPAEVGARWQDKMELPFTDPLTGQTMRMNRHKVIAMALNVGNEGNLQRLSDGYGINPGALTDYLNETLTPAEWQFVQGVWDTIDTLWPEIARIEREVNGVAPDKVEAREVVTPSGTLRGGYYPAVYDSTRDYKAEENRGRESDLFEGAYTRATTRASSTKERSEAVKRPILLDLGVINRHLGEVIHDITHREAVIRANRFLTNERVMRVVDEALGPEIRKQFRPWLKFVANSWAVERAGNEGFGKFIGQLRANVTVVGMGLRATTMVTQIAGYSNSIEVVGEAAMAKAVAQFYRDPVGVGRWVMENSDEVRNRMDTLDRDIRTELARLDAVTVTGKMARTVIDSKRFMFHGIGYMDRLVSMPTWIAGYNNALAAGMDEQDARYAGDKAVRQSQGAGGPKDLAAIQRGTGKWGEALKLFTMFYSFFSAQYQRQRTLGRDIAGNDQRRSRSVHKLAARAFFMLVLPPLLVEVLRGAVGASSGPDDEEWWAEWVARKLLANSLGPIPVVRDVFEPTWNAVAGNRVFNPSISPLQRAMDSVVKVGRDVGKLVEGEETKSATKDVLELAGYTTGLVPGQIASATQFLVDVGNGDADPKGFRDWVEGLSTGKLKED